MNLGGGADSPSAPALSAAARSIEGPEVDEETLCRQDRLSDRANMDVLKMEQSIEQNLSKAMTGLCDQFSQQFVNQSNFQHDHLQGVDERIENAVPIRRVDVPDYRSQAQLALLQQSQNQPNQLADVESLKMEVESLRQDLSKVSGHAASAADLKLANAVGDKVCRDMQVRFNALQSRMSSEVCDAVGQLRAELGLVKADVARTSESLQHVESEVRSLRANVATEQLTARLASVEEEVRRNSKTLSHVGEILNVTHEITTGSDKVIGRMGHEVSNWRENESRLEKRLMAVEQVLHQLGSFAVKNAEQQFEMRKAHEAEQVKDVELPRSVDLRLNLESLIGKMNETLQAPQPKRPNSAASAVQQRSLTGAYTRALSPTGSIVHKPGTAGSSLILGAATGVQGGTSLVLNAAMAPATGSSHAMAQVMTSSPASLLQRRNILAATSGESDVASAVGSATSAVGRRVSAELPGPPRATSAAGYSVVPRQAALSAMPVAHQAQQPH